MRFNINVLIWTIFKEYEYFSSHLFCFSWISLDSFTDLQRRWQCCYLLLFSNPTWSKTRRNNAHIHLLHNAGEHSLCKCFVNILPILLGTLFLEIYLLLSIFLVSSTRSLRPAFYLNNHGVKVFFPYYCFNLSFPSNLSVSSSHASLLMSS